MLIGLGLALFAAGSHFVGVRVRAQR